MMIKLFQLGLNINLIAEMYLNGVILELIG
nr:MAG TPA: hypothetical protein [Caudoviricetes sp.]